MNPDENGFLCAAVEQKARNEVIKELDEVIQLQEDKLKKMDGRKTSTKRPGQGYEGSDDMETDAWEEVTMSQACQPRARRRRRPTEDGRESSRM